jgi:hypothetical protein
MLNPSDLNSATRLMLVAENCGAQPLDDPERFDRMLGRGSFALVRRVVKSGHNGSGKRRVHSSHAPLARPGHQSLR